MTPLTVTPAQAIALEHYAQHADLLAPLLSVDSPEGKYRKAIAHINAHADTLAPLLDMDTTDIERAMTEGWREKGAEAV